MKRQQVNLYQTETKSGHLSLNTTTISVALVVFVMLLAVWVMSQSAQRNKLADQLANLHNQQGKLANQLQQLRADLPADQSTRQEQERLQLENKLRELQQIHQLMAQQETSKSTSFAAQMSGLAQHHPDGVALTEILFLAGGRQVELKGHARPAEAVPQYLQKLQTDQRFQGVQFGPLHIQRDKNRNGAVRFRLSREAATP